MANQNQVNLIEQGVEVWNHWRIQNPQITPDLSSAYLSECKLGGINLSRSILRNTNFFQSDLAGGRFDHADLSGSNLNFCDLMGSSFVGANLSSATLMGTHALQSNFHEARLNEAVLTGAIFTQSNFRKADLSGAYLTGVQFVGTILEDANISGCNVYGISVWDARLEGCVQQDLVITPDNSNEVVTVDNVTLAQFMYLILNNEELQHFVNTTSNKMILILGRFTEERKRILDSLRQELRSLGYVPVIFDFKEPSKRNLTETASLLAHLAKFIIADITDPLSVPQELQSIVPNLPSVPLVPIISKGSPIYSLFESYNGRPWVLPLEHYESPEHLLKDILPKAIRIIEKGR